MERYLIALDMDGTLLKADQTISEYTIQTIKKVSALGHIVILASGRPLSTLKEYYEALDLKSPVIAYNGGAIYKMNTSFETFEQTYDLEDVLYCYNALQSKGKLINAMCETFSTVYLYKNDQTFDRWFFRDDMNIVNGDFNKNLKENPLSMIFYLLDEDMPILMEASKNLKNHAKMRQWSGGRFAEVYYPEYNKFNGVIKVAEFYNIDLDHIIAFGDAGNDYELIANLKYGVAMKNAAPEILNVAHHITKEDNEHDGVAIFLKEFFSLD